MLFRFSGLFILGVASLALSTRIPSRHIRHEARRHLPQGWTPVRRAEPHLLLPLSVGLVQSNLDNLEAYLLEVSHPDSPSYGQHWTPERVAETFKPSAEAVDTVRDWIANEGAIGHARVALDRSGSWLTANVTVAEAERLLKTEYFVFEHADGSSHVACEKGYHVPEDVSRHVDIITPTLHFDIKVERDDDIDRRDVRHTEKAEHHANSQMGELVDSFATDLSKCDEVINLACLRALYDFSYTPVAPRNNSIGVVEYTPQTHIPTDFDVFFQNYSATQVGQRPTLVSVDGGSLILGGDDDAVESSLDLQYVLGLVGSEQEVLLYQVGDFVQGASFNNFLDGLDEAYCTSDGGDVPVQDASYPDPFPGGFQGHSCGTAKVAHVISTSYTYQEVDLTPAYQRRQCAEYGKLSLTGVTFVYSSGDAGVQGADHSCLDNNGQPQNGAKGFNPSFPAGCPYVTAIGATQIVPGNKVTDKESAVFQRFPSGGGFSNIFPQPSWQQDAVSNYLTKFPPGYAPGVFNQSGRAYPDLSANGLNYTVVVDGKFRLVSGTSASAPTVAAILSAVNDARIAKGKGPIGWINPTIYSPAFAGVFNDITNGSNPGCGTQGFAAQPGWDPVTGLGTPNFPKMVAQWLSLP